MSAIIEIVEITLRILKNSSDDLALHFDNIYFAFSKLTNFYALPFVLTIFLLALLTACAVLICIFSLHILLRFLLRKKGRVFISYYHKDEELATEVSERLIDSGLLTVKLPFIKEVDHDDLLDSIRHEILDCDVFLCIPGGNPSFVENEVSMAFSLDKPQVFLVSTERPARLPNTAKKGFPLFNLGLSRQESFRTIALLCSYISHDKNATLRFYGLLFNYVGSCIALVARSF